MEEKNKGGRPKKSPIEKKKYTLPPVHMGTKDYFEIKAKAMSSRLTLTEYQRRIILNGYVVERLSPDQYDIYRKLAGIGNNCNQMSHLAWVNGYDADAQLYHENACNISKLIRQILNDGKNNKRR